MRNVKRGGQRTTPVRVYGDVSADWLAWLHVISLLVERVTELFNVHTITSHLWTCRELLKSALLSLAL